MRESNSDLFAINPDLSFTRFFINNEELPEPELPFFSPRIEPLEAPLSPLMNINIDENEYMERVFYLRPPIRRIRIYHQPELKELESNNENFIKENNIKFNLYPLYINWKKIESKKVRQWIIFTLRSMNLLRASPFSRPLLSSARSVSWHTSSFCFSSSSVFSI